MYDENTSVLFNEFKAHCVEIGIVVNQISISISNYIYKTSKIYKVTRFTKNIKLRQCQLNFNAKDVLYLAL